MILDIAFHELILNWRLVNIIPFYFLSKSIHIMLPSVSFNYLLEPVYLMNFVLLSIPHGPRFIIKYRHQRRNLIY